MKKPAAAAAATTTATTNTILPWRNESELAKVKKWFFESTSNHPLSNSTSPLQSSTIDNPSDEKDNSSPSFDDDDDDDTHENRQKAINQVQIWTWKFHTTPHAVISTALLTDAKLHDDLRREAQDRNRRNADAWVVNEGEGGNPEVRTTRTTMVISETAMKSIYSHTFIRFVNGFVDRDVKKSSSLSCEAFGLSPFSAASGIPSTLTSTSTSTPATKATTATLGKQPITDHKSKNHITNTTTNTIPSADRTDINVNTTANQPSNPSSSTTSMSMYTIATSLGMPITFIDFRHRVTHHGADLPSLNELRRMNTLALEWIYKRWWVWNTSSSSSSSAAVSGSGSGSGSGG